MSSLTEHTDIGTITVTRSGHIEVRSDTVILRDGAVIAGPTYHRSVLAPGDSLAGADARVEAVAAAVWTPEVIAGYRAERDAAAAGL